MENLTSVPWDSVTASGASYNTSKISSFPTGTHSARYTDEDIIEQILKIQASKEEILQALRVVFPEKFI